MTITFWMPKLDDPNYNQTETIWQLARDIQFTDIVYSKRTSEDLYLHMVNLALLDDVYYARGKRIADGEEDDDWVGPIKVIPNSVNNLAADVRPEAYVETPILSYEITDDEIIFRTTKIRAGGEAHQSTTWILDTGDRIISDVESSDLTEKRYNKIAIGFNNTNKLVMKCIHHSTINACSKVAKIEVIKHVNNLTIEGNMIGIDPKYDTILTIKDSDELHVGDVTVTIIDEDTGIEVMNKVVNGYLLTIPANILKPQKTYTVTLNDNGVKMFNLSTIDYLIPEYKDSRRVYNDVLVSISDFPIELNSRVVGFELPGNNILVQETDKVSTFKFIDSNSFTKMNELPITGVELRSYCNGLNNVIYFSYVADSKFYIVKAKLNDVTGRINILKSKEVVVDNLNNAGRFLQYDFSEEVLRFNYEKDGISYIGAIGNFDNDVINFNIPNVSMPIYSYLTSDGKLVGLTDGAEKKFIIVDLYTKDYSVVRTLNSDYDNADFFAVRRLNNYILFLPKNVAGSFLKYDKSNGSVQVVTTTSVYDGDVVVTTNNGNGLFINGRTTYLLK